jgi:flagellar biogenesis protein FliO
VSPVMSYVLETLITVAAISALAVLVLFGARRIGVGRPSGPLLLVGRLPLEGRRTVYLVRIGETVYVLAGSEAGLTKIGELPRADLAGIEPEGAMTFRDVLSRVRGRTAGERPLGAGAPADGTKHADER